MVPQNPVQDLVDNRGSVAPTLPPSMALRTPFVRNGSSSADNTITSNADYANKADGGFASDTLISSDADDANITGPTTSPALHSHAVSPLTTPSALPSTTVDTPEHKDGGVYS